MEHLQTLFETGMTTLFEMGKTTCALLLSRKENEEILDKKIEELSCRESDVREELERAKLKYGKTPKSEVDLWFRDVQNFKNEVHDIKQKLEEVRWNHFYLLINLAKQVEEKIKEAVELKENGRFLEGLVLVDLLPGSLDTFPLTKLVGETTAIRNLKKIEECLMNEEVGKIGVYGMGGVGKTTIMEHIHNKFKNVGTFECVIWVTVSKESYLKKLQDDVSKALDISLSNKEDELLRSAKLFGAFNQIGRFLLILDDMWSTFPLTKIGIPEPNEENKCKVVWTTRSKKVCRGMGSERIIKVEGLTKDESWNLFKEKFGTDSVLSPEIDLIAKAVVEECDGLPLAIITVGAAMRGEDDIRIWRNALDDLRNSRPELEGLEDDVFFCLKFSFDHLKTQRLRDCFLYCALYPEDSMIDCNRLIENWMADGFFDEIDDREKGFDKGYTIINDLKDACMLENVSETSVKMHDLLRDLAIAITRKSPRFVVKAGFNVHQFPKDENLMDDVVRISLMSSEITMLTCLSKSPKLSTLLLAKSRLGNNIHQFFFEHMQNLKVLDLSHTYITCLPQSLSNLVNLHALLLEHCSSLEEVFSLVGLRKLQVLNLSETPIQYLPEGMDGLTNLRCLDLSFTRRLEIFPVGILSNLSYLEELLMVSSKWKWSSNGNARGAGVEEIVRLAHLRKLLVDFMDFSAWSSYVRSANWQVLKCYILRVGYEDVIMDVRDVRCNFYSGERQVHVNSVTSITDCMGNIVFPGSNLTGLWIEKLQDLRTICMEEPTQGDTLANLKCIEIYLCPKLKYVFSVGWLQTLQNLAKIEVYSCLAMEEMLVDMEDMGGAGNNTTITLPRLKSLILRHLPKLKTICKRLLICSSLESIEVEHCQKLKKLPFSVDSVASSSLKEIKGSIRWWDSLEWDSPNTKMHFQPFFKSSGDVVAKKGGRKRGR